MHGGGACNVEWNMGWQVRIDVTDQLRFSKALSRSCHYVFQYSIKMACGMCAQVRVAALSEHAGAFKC